jgi:hypothetical protein
MTEVEKSAFISPCGRYRYVLRRDWSNGIPLVFVGLNPSTADDVADDPTIRICVSLARRWGYSGMMMLNALAWRDKDPRKMLAAEDPIGPENDYWLRQAAEGYDYGMVLPNFVACWGVNCPPDRAAEVYSIFPRMYCLGTTKSGAPRHPLRTKIVGLDLWRPATIGSPS